MSICLVGMETMVFASYFETLNVEPGSRWAKRITIGVRCSDPLDLLGRHAGQVADSGSGRAEQGDCISHAYVQPTGDSRRASGLPLFRVGPSMTSKPPKPPRPCPARQAHRGYRDGWGGGSGAYSRGTGEGPCRLGHRQEGRCGPRRGYDAPRSRPTTSSLSTKRFA